MITPETFVSRWARLKRNSDIRREMEAGEDRVPASAETSATGVEAAIGQSETAAAADAPFDPASLPSIDAIGVDTDIRGFLQGRVPAELTRAALRRAWASDPAIRDFIGIAENQWNFNDPEAMPGFGPLEEGYDVSGLLSQALGGRDRAEAIPQISVSIQQPPPTVTDRQPADPGLDVRQSLDDGPRNLSENGNGEAAEPENNQEANVRRPDQRRHGSALPRRDSES
jgi:Protein of unknown function (DUF3306)